MRLLSQNSKTAKYGIWNWSLPANTIQLSDGSDFDTCPNAGVCSTMCCTKLGSYVLDSTRTRHIQNLELTLTDLNAFKLLMVENIQQKRNVNAVRVHDAGDFYSIEYFQAWCDIANELPETNFYAYTKQISMSRSLNIPKNLTLIYSFGGTEDHLIDTENDRHCDVFHSLKSLEEAGYFLPGDNDYLSATADTNKIGLLQTNMAFITRLGRNSFREKQLNYLLDKAQPSLFDQ